MLQRQIYYSFPFRLLALHLRSHLVLVLIWMFLTLLVTGLVGRFFGTHYLMLAPEYQGEVGFFSFLLTGAAFGGFVMIWHLTTYLLCANRFPFLATLNAPFTKFCINNNVIPLSFLATYLSAVIWFQWHDEMTRRSDIIQNIGAFLLGLSAFVAVLTAYLYFTNKDIASFLRPGTFVPKLGGRLLVPGQRLPTLGEIKSGTTRWRVDTYLTERFRLRLVRSAAHYDPDLLAKVFRQNHLNAVVVQGVALLLMMLQGWLMDTEALRFPTSVSIFVLASIVMSAFGAITFWFRKWGTLVFLCIMFIVNWMTGKGFFHYRSQAYGLHYESAAQLPYYDYALVNRLSADSIIRADQKDMEQVLERWLARQPQYTDGRKPKMVLICTSGGGHKAALWTARVLQQADLATEGRLLQQTALITGASGGMLGAAYLREVMLRQHQGEPLDWHDETLLDNLGKDLLNAITSAMVANDFFYPINEFEQNSTKYRKDRGFYFEQQFNRNLSGIMTKTLADYRHPEAHAVVPMLLLSPFIINDNRRLLISPLGMSFLTRPMNNPKHNFHLEADGVELRQLFAAQGADSLRFTTALRMNCTFPLILPNVWLPTRPSLEIMDAGMRDNFGIGLAVRFAQTFANWIKTHTDGVVVVQIRCWDRAEKIAPHVEKGVVDNLLTAAGTAADLPIRQDYDHDTFLSLLGTTLGQNYLDVIRFTYEPVRQQRKASLSFHLSRREQLDILQAYHQSKNLIDEAELRRILGINNKPNH
jgi:Patatin-like phospholipase